jgi:hypothetical protein
VRARSSDSEAGRGSQNSCQRQHLAAQRGQRHGGKEGAWPGMLCSRPACTAPGITDGGSPPCILTSHAWWYEVQARTLEFCNVRLSCEWRLGGTDQAEAGKLRDCCWMPASETHSNVLMLQQDPARPSVVTWVGMGAILAIVGMAVIFTQSGSGPSSWHARRR